MALRGFQALCENPYFDSLVEQLDKDFSVTINRLLDTPPGVMSADVMFQLIGEARGVARLKSLLKVTVDDLESKRKEQEQPTNEQNENQTELPADDA